MGWPPPGTDIFPSRAVAEENARASEERYRTLFDSIDQGFCVVEVLFDEASRPVDYRFLETNRVFEKLTGITDAVGRRMREIAPAHEEHWFRIYGQVALTGEARRFELPALALGRHYDVYAFRVGRPEERQVAILFSDITERRRSEAERRRIIQELREAQDMLRADLDATGRLLEVGSLFLRAGNVDSVLGKIVEAAIAITGADFGNLQLLDPASGDLRIAAHRGFPNWWIEFWDATGRGQGACGTALERGERVIIEDVEKSPIFAGTPALEIQLRAGVRAVQSTPLLSRTGDPIGMLSTHFRDPGRPPVHALRRLDLLARQAGDVLDRARAEQELEKANERLRLADRRKDEFLGMLSHELRNPLAPIRNAIQVLERSPPGSERAHRAQAVLARQADHLTRLVEDLLDVTRITSGKIRLNREQLDLCELARRTVDDHRGSFAEHGVALEFRPAPEPVRVTGDATRLAQVIGNLLQNSVKFTARGGTCTLEVEADARHGEAIVRVHDSGIGFAPELGPRIFEAFTQADAPLDRPMGGLGLGLTIVRSLVEMHGGSVRAESDGPGKGASFCFVLPLERAAPAAARPPGQEQGRRHRVLIVEDNEDAAQSLRDVLDLVGHEAQVARSGPEGIEKARTFRAEVVLCDIGLPGMDGYEVARAMRADAGLVHVGLVALTGYAGPDAVARARDAGFDGHLAKPPTLEGIERALDEAVEARRERTRPAS